MTPEDKAFFESMYGGSTGGGSGSGGGAGTGGTSGCDAPAQVFATSCALTACHDSTTRQGELDLTGDPYAALVNKAPAPNVPTVTFCGDSGAVLINPSTPAQSLLYTKISASPSCGGPMPFPLGPMDSGSAAQCVLSWIQSKSMSP